ncbi:MAG TPA: molybdopterin cofactor-binding domain-containing protein, partial [Spongiibacteraceae bacterium]|nr:molybdopterin cofactor-binding domain-containing protein [Spongiibacteraceae bacterium]
MNMNRRQFLRNGAALGSGLVIGFELDGCGERKFPASQSDSFQPSSFLEISPGGEYILQLTRAEMGQGVYTGLTTLVAEELDIDPAEITVVFAPVTRSLGYQATGGSNSIRSTFESLRQVGANAKAVLLAAAAKDWNVPAAQLIAENGAIHDTKSQRKANYSALVATAKTLPVPKQAPLKSPAQFKLIGLFDQRLDAPQKVDGSAVYGIDIHRENMAYAVLVRCPHFGGTVKNFDASA